MNESTQKRVNPSDPNAWLVLGDPYWYREKTPNKIRFWFARMTSTPNKKPTENEVGNRLSTKVPKTPSKRWINPVHTDATTSALEPPWVCKLTTDKVQRNCVGRRIWDRHVGDQSWHSNKGRKWCWLKIHIIMYIHIQRNNNPIHLCTHFQELQWQSIPLQRASWYPRPGALILWDLLHTRKRPWTRNHFSGATFLPWCCRPCCPCECDTSLLRNFNKNVCWVVVDGKCLLYVLDLMCFCARTVGVSRYHSSKWCREREELTKQKRIIIVKEAVSRREFFNGLSEVGLREPAVSARQK